MSVLPQEELQYFSHETSPTHFFTEIQIFFYSSFSLGPGVLVPAMRLKENKVNVARSYLSDVPPRSVPAMHLSEMVLCVSLKATILCTSMNDSICLALFFRPCPLALVEKETG